MKPPSEVVEAGVEELLEAFEIPNPLPRVEEVPELEDEPIVPNEPVVVGILAGAEEPPKPALDPKAPNDDAAPPNDCLEAPKFEFELKAG